MILEKLIMGMIRYIRPLYLKAPFNGKPVLAGNKLAVKVIPIKDVESIRKE